MVFLRSAFGKRGGTAMMTNGGWRSRAALDSVTCMHHIHRDKRT